MRLYSNIPLSVIDRMHIWKNRHPHVYRIQRVYRDSNTLSLEKPYFYASLPFDLRAQYMWEYPDKQIPVPMKLQAWNLNQDGFFYDNAISLPSDIQTGDVILADHHNLKRRL